MNMIEAFKLSEAELNRCWDILTKYAEASNSFMLSKLGKKPPIIWSKFGFHTAGRYRFYTNSTKDQIEMNTNYLNIPNPEEFIVSTMRHEIAHCINHRLGSKGVHDRSWKVIAMMLGDDGEIYHNYDKPSNAPVKTKTIHSFNCTCGQTFNLTDRQLTSAKNGKYICKSCKKNLGDLFDSNGNLL